MPAIYTLGYTSCDPSDIETFARLNQTMVVDTRFSPHSRVPRWDGAALKTLIGANYVHVRDLGNRNYRNGGAIEIANLRRGVDIVKAYFKRDLNVLLLCACPELHTCHRRIVADALVAQTGHRLVHLTPASLVAMIADLQAPRAAQMSLWDAS